MTRSYRDVSDGPFAIRTGFVPRAGATTTGVPLPAIGDPAAASPRTTRVTLDLTDEELAHLHGVVTGLAGSSSQAAKFAQIAAANQNNAAGIVGSLMGTGGGTDPFAGLLGGLTGTGSADGFTDPTDPTVFGDGATQGQLLADGSDVLGDGSSYGDEYGIPGPHSMDDPLSPTIEIASPFGDVEKETNPGTPADDGNDSAFRTMIHDLTHFGTNEGDKSNPPSGWGDESAFTGAGQSHGTPPITVDQIDPQVIDLPGTTVTAHGTIDDGTPRAQPVHRRRGSHVIDTGAPPPDGSTDAPAPVTPDSSQGSSYRDTPYSLKGGVPDGGGFADAPTLRIVGGHPMLGRVEQTGQGSYHPENTRLGSAGGTDVGLIAPHHSDPSTDVDRPRRVSAGERLGGHGAVIGPPPPHRRRVPDPIVWSRGGVAGLSLSGLGAASARSAATGVRVAIGASAGQTSSVQTAALGKLLSALAKVAPGG